MRFNKKQIKRNFGVTEMRILHFMTYLEDNNFYKDHKTALKNFDNYLSSFFDLSESSEKIVFGEIEPHNAVEFLKIIASVTFSRLLKENSLLFSADSVNGFLTERLEKFNLEKFKESPSLYAQYLVICNNIKIVAFTKCDCIDGGIMARRMAVGSLTNGHSRRACIFVFSPSFFQYS